jgi:hypothetical protein
MIRLLFVLAAALSITGCVPSYYHRISDGVRVDQNPTVQSQFEIEKTICMGEVAKMDSTSRGDVFERAGYRETVLRACLAQKGYVVRPG